MFLVLNGLNGFGLLQIVNGVLEHWIVFVDLLQTQAHIAQRESGIPQTSQFLAGVRHQTSCLAVGGHMLYILTVDDDRKT